MPRGLKNDRFYFYNANTQMNISHRTIGSLVAEDFRRATVFKGHGIDFCCGGGTTLEVACQERELLLDEVLAELEVAEKGREGDSIQPDRWDLGFLVDYIVNHHHTYVTKSIPVLQEFTQKVARVHGVANPEVASIAEIFERVAIELQQHMIKEEGILFPFVKEMEDAERSEESLSLPMFGTVRNPIRMMEHEHDSAGSAMRRIRELSNDYTPPEHACNTYRVAYAKLEEFESDLHHHIHLENNILFPKAARLEEKLLAGQSAGPLN